MKIAMLTTVDNPHSPFDDFDAWYAYDIEAGYYTNEYLARFVLYSPDLPDQHQLMVVEQAIDEIVEENVLGIYRKVTREIEIA